ncbi:MAG: sodium:proton antiporter [Chlamydia sp. 32-24]|nr:MAG: sodium:proton antiporter [Chlamydia sp. 32-24]
MVIESFFLQLVFILFFARVFGEIAARFDIPSVIGELVAGVILGPSLLGWISSTETIKALAEIGIILLLFEVGLETEITRLAKTGFKSFLVAIVGVLAPFILGFTLSYYFFELSGIVSLFIACTLTATSIGITIRVLNDLKLQKSEEAQIVLGAAVIDDIIGIILLSLLYEFATSGGIKLLNLGKLTLFIFLFLIIAPIAAKSISYFIKKYEKKSVIPGLLPSIIVSLLLFFAWLAHLSGAPELLGGFAAGLALSRQFFLPFGASLKLDPDFSKKVEHQMRPIIHLFTPIFFVTVGLSLNLRQVDWHSSYIWILSLSLLLVGIIGKLSSGFILPKTSPWIKWAVGIAMVPRGEVGLIFAEVGKNSKVLNDEVYAAVLIVIALTTIFTPFALKWFYLKKNKTVRE